MRRLLVVAATLLLLSGCAPGTDPLPTSTKSNIDVDTPQLRQMKAEAGIEPCRPGTAAATDDGLPDITLPCFGGGPDVDLSTLRGPLVINVWQVACLPCRKEMPLFARLHREAGERVGVLGIDLQDPVTELAMKQLGTTGVTYPQVADPDAELALADRLRVVGLPTTAFVRSDGTISYVHPGEFTSYDDLLDAVREHLGVDL